MVHVSCLQRAYTDDALQEGSSSVCFFAPLLNAYSMRAFHWIMKPRYAGRRIYGQLLAQHLAFDYLGVAML